MKKSLVSLVSLALIVGLVSLTSCNKEETMGNGTQFRATMESCTSQNGKTILDGTALNWVSGDQIAVYGTAGAGIYTATPQNPATTAVFDNVSGTTGDGPFTAFYPTTLTTDGENITLPATQTYVEGTIHEFPMYAESSDNQLAFKNLCGVLKLNLTKVGVNISSISVTAATEINGTFSVSYSSGAPQLAYSTNGTNTTTLTCATSQSIAEGKDFYIYLPHNLTGYSGLRIEMNTDDGRYCVKTANTPIVVERSKVTVITLGESNLNFVEPHIEGTLSGLFSVSATQQVYFSSGNLQYQASTDTWRFAEHQYDYVGGGVYPGNVYENSIRCDNLNISNTYTGWIDLFGWGTGSNPTLTSIDTSDYYTFVDWGTNAISNGGDQANVWRTLTYNEMRYIFYTRTDASLKYGTGTVFGVHGMIVLPDDWTLPEGCTFTSGVASDNYSVNWTRNNYSLAQWASMEEAGAVFLPAAGSRYYGYSYDSYPYGYRWYINDAGNHGFYWTSSVWEDWGGTLDFGVDIRRTASWALIEGFSVRLVRDKN